MLMQNSSNKTYLGVVYKGISKESAEFDSLLKQPEVSALLSKKAVLKLNIQSNMLQMKLKTANCSKTISILILYRFCSNGGKTLEIFSVPQYFYTNIQLKCYPLIDLGISSVQKTNKIPRVWCKLVFSASLKHPQCKRSQWA